MDRWQLIPFWDEDTSKCVEGGGYFMGRKGGTHEKVSFDTHYIMENSKQVVTKSITELEVTKDRTFFQDLIARACRE